MHANIDSPGDKISPRKARREFLNSKKGSVKQSTVRAYKFPTRHFVEFCEDHNIEAIGEVGSRAIESWKADRRKEIKQITLHNNVKHLRVFIRWCETAELIEQGTADRIAVPKVSDEQAVSSQVLELEQAEDILRYLDTYEYATRKHALFYTLWHTGCRISGALSLDLEDFLPKHDGSGILKFRNRKAEGTALKNGNVGERNVTLTEEVRVVLQDYIDGHRENVTDEFDREPLFSISSGRLSRQNAYKDYTALSRPCYVADVCPHDREIDSCEAAQKKKKAFGCPSSKSLHPIRRGSITYHINRGWPKEKLAERVDVSVDVLNKHYDARRKEDEREGRRQFLHLM